MSLMVGGFLTFFVLPFLASVVFLFLFFRLSFSVFISSFVGHHALDAGIVFPAPPFCASSVLHSCVSLILIFKTSRAW